MFLHCRLCFLVLVFSNTSIYSLHHTEVEELQGKWIVSNSPEKAINEQQRISVLSFLEQSLFKSRWACLRHPVHKDQALVIKGPVSALVAGNKVFTFDKRPGYVNRFNFTTDSNRLCIQRADSENTPYKPYLFLINKNRKITSSLIFTQENHILEVNQPVFLRGLSYSELNAFKRSLKGKFKKNQYYRMLIPKAPSHIFSEIPDYIIYEILFKLEKRRPLSIDLGVISGPDKTYFNGDYLAETGDSKQGLLYYDKRRIYSLPERMQKEGENRLTILARSVKGGWPAYFSEEVVLGDSNLLHEALMKSELITIGLAVAYFVVGLYFALLFVRTPKTVENFFFSQTAILSAIYFFMRTQAKYYLTSDFLLIKKVEYLVLYLLVPIFILYFKFYYPGRKTILEKVAFGLLYLFVGFSIFSFVFIACSSDVVEWYNYTIYYYQPSWVLPVIIILYIMVREIHYFMLKSFQQSFYFRVSLFFEELSDRGRKLYYRFVDRLPVLPGKHLAWRPRPLPERIQSSEPDGMYMLTGLVIFLTTVVHDVLINLTYIQGTKLSTYGFSAFVLGLAAILANRFVRLHKEVEKLNSGLEKLVDERTRELKQTLEQVQNLKTQQDGDYFLTSLLVKPLSANKSDSSIVAVDCFVRQKKKFQFRKWKADIGGDINTSYSVILEGKKYIVFMNADAMGKSIQGAGGALVTGSVFQANIQRTRLNNRNQDITPADWLKSSYLELQKVFESFDGSMLISIVMGLVREDNGMMYYMNSDHPYTVLYRDRNASFIEEGTVMRKIGIHGLKEEEIRIKTFQLLPGDVLIAGSDGRDDISLGYDSFGNRIINENENLFLEIVEKGDAQIQNIYNMLKQKGELIDDLSMVRIEYRS